MANPLDNTAINSPSGAPSGTLLSPGHGSLLPHGLVLPHNLPRPEDFRLPSIATPTVSKPLVSSIIHGSPPASGGPRLTLPSPDLGVAGPKVAASRARARGLFQAVRRRSRNAIGALPEAVRNPLSKLGERSPLRRADRADGQIGNTGMRWG